MTDELVVKGLRVSKGRHTLSLRYDPTEEKNLQVWVGATPNDEPAEVGAYLGRNKFLKAVSKVFNVYIEDCNDPLHARVYQNGRAY